MEFSLSEIIAISAVILNIIVYLSRVPSKRDLKDLGDNLTTRIDRLDDKLSERIDKLDSKFTDHLMYMHGNVPKQKSDVETSDDT